MGSLSLCSFSIYMGERNRNRRCHCKVTPPGHRLLPHIQAINRGMGLIPLPDAIAVRLKAGSYLDGGARVILRGPFRSL
jgi:hypothetical protein